MLLLTGEEMRQLDRRTIESGHATGIELMRRAGAGVAATIERRYGSALGLRALVLCGTGNNGGDGFVAARCLRERGVAPRVVVLGDPARIGDDARLALDELRAAGLEIAAAATEDALAAIVRSHDHWDFAIDALLGTGARGAPEGAIAAGVQALREIDDAGTRVVAVDIPTGVDPDTGAIARRAVRADLTVTFGAPKRGHVLYPGRAFVGRLEIVDIGLIDPEPGDALRRTLLATRAHMASLLPHRDPRAHKGTAGRVLVIGGSPGLTGALVLAARAANRVGAGYVQVAAPASLNESLAARLVEQMPLPCPETHERTLARTTFEAIFPLIERADAIAVGPGLSSGDEPAALARRIATESRKPVVIDADALNSLPGSMDIIARAAGPRVLTPHLGEMARLTSTTADALEQGRIDEARRWAERWHATIVLKGAPTVTAGADGVVIVNPTGNPGMATAGMGDVLTGVIAGLIAQGVPARDAAALGVYVHGDAGDRMAEARGRRGLVASDVVEALPLAIRGLESPGVTGAS